MNQVKVEKAAVGFAVVALVVFIINACLIMDAQATQRDIGARQAEIQRGIQISQLNNDLIRALGVAAIDKKDTKIKDLLSQNGITVEKRADAPKPAAKQ
ncbi:MAG: hypothetical protein AB7G06_06285 [Bdellovibrionales bacterium]